jgi:PAS domain S-box-containing protein
MAKKPIAKTEKQLLLENEELRARLAEAEETLNAIRNGEVDAIVVSGTDGEKVFSLTSAETPYRLIIEEMNEGAVVLSADGIILYCNRRFAELVSASLEQIMGSNYTRFVAESDKPKFDVLLQAGLKGKSSGEITCVIHASIPVHLNLSFNPLPPDMLGDVSVMALDITELKQKEEELRHARDTLEQQVTERTAALTKTIEELAASRFAIMNMMEDAMEAKKALEIANNELLVQITKRRQAEEDIHKLNQELEQKVIDRTAQLETLVEELQNFTYSISHDLRAPLRHINSFAELLNESLSGSLDEQGQRYLQVISDSAKQIGILMDALLEFVRIGRAEMMKTKVHTNQLVKEAINTLEAETKGRDLIWKIDHLPELYGDPAMLRIVFVTLISNALKFTRPRPQAKIEIGCADNRNKIIFSVKDNGVGFDIQYADKLFRVFQRLHLTKDFEGIGIGLANVKRIIQRHGGRTWAEGKVDEGATFYFSLPKEMRDEEEGGRKRDEG